MHMMMDIDEDDFVSQSQVQVSAEPSRFMLVVRNLSDKVNNQMLRELFTPYNAIRCRVVYRNNRSKGWAGIEFQNQEDANRAKEQLRNTKLDGRAITILDAQASDRDWFKKTKPGAGRGGGEASWGGRGGSGGHGRVSRWGPPTQPPGPGGFAPMGEPPMRSDMAPPFQGGGYFPQQQPPTQQPQQEFQPFQQSQQFAPMVSPMQPLRPALHHHLVGQPLLPALGSFPTTEFGLSDDTPTDFRAITDLRNQKFHIIEVQVAWEVQGIGIPCEIAIATFTFGEGEKSVFHRFINPGHLPICYVPNAICQTNTVHSIPHHNFQHAEKNYGKLWNELLQYFDLERTGIPLLYAKAPVTKSNSIAWLAQKAGQPNPFRGVRPVEEMIDYFHSVSSISMHSSAIQDYFGSVSSTTLRGKCNFHEVVSQGLSDHHAGGPSNAQCALANARVCCEILKTVFERLRIDERRTS